MIDKFFLIDSSLYKPGSGVGIQLHQADAEGKREVSFICPPGMTLNPDVFKRAYFYEQEPEDGGQAVAVMVLKICDGADFSSSLFDSSTSELLRQFRYYIGEVMGSCLDELAEAANPTVQRRIR